MIDKITSYSPTIIVFPCSTTLANCLPMWKVKKQTDLKASECHSYSLTLQTAPRTQDTLSIHRSSPLHLSSLLFSGMETSCSWDPSISAGLSRSKEIALSCRFHQSDKMQAKSLHYTHLHCMCYLLASERGRKAEHSLQITSPHNLQWWRLLLTAEKGRWHFMQRFWSSSFFQGTISCSRAMERNGIVERTMREEMVRWQGL